MISRIRSYQDKVFWGTKGNPTHGVTPRKDFDHYIANNFVFDSGGFCGAVEVVKMAMLELPATRLVFGTDYPQEIRTADVNRNFITEIRKLGPDGEKLLTGNAGVLLKGRV